MSVDSINDRPAERLATLTEQLNIKNIRRHIFLCADQTNPKCCDKERGIAAWDFLKKRLKELGLSEQGGILRTKANCLRICEGGPIALVYPEGTWYRECDPPANPCTWSWPRMTSFIASGYRACTASAT